MVSVPNEDDVERSLLLWVGELGAYGIGQREIDETEAQVTRHMEALNYE